MRASRRSEAAPSGPSSSRAASQGGYRRDTGVVEPVVVVPWAPGPLHPHRGGWAGPADLRRPSGVPIDLSDPDVVALVDAYEAVLADAPPNGAAITAAHFALLETASLLRWAPRPGRPNGNTSAATPGPSPGGRHPRRPTSWPTCGRRWMPAGPRRAGDPAAERRSDAGEGHQRADQALVVGPEVEGDGGDVVDEGDQLDAARSRGGRRSSRSCRRSRSRRCAPPCARRGRRTAAGGDRLRRTRRRSPGGTSTGRRSGRRSASGGSPP